MARPGGLAGCAAPCTVGLMGSWASKCPLFVSLEASSLKTLGSEYYCCGQALGDLASGPHDTHPFLSEMAREPHGLCHESLFQRIRNDNVCGALLPRDPGPMGKKNRELGEREREREREREKVQGRVSVLS